jgi:hypothetical protein
LLKGKLQVGNQILETRDGLGIWDTDSISIAALEQSEVLLMEVPMDF